MSYESFEELKIAVKENNYQKIWELKKEFYTDHEKKTIDMMEGLTFKTSIWTYFVDKVP
ncbi:hypothetical protein J5751_00635 [bacterium]|nr:hypothetical protein [bacterium]